MCTCGRSSSSGACGVVCGLGSSSDAVVVVNEYD